jgi:1-acyl-sn-glycerol-3-phosphate acyltransferase
MNMTNLNSIKQSARVILNTLKSLKDSMDEQSEMEQIKREWLTKFFSQLNLDLKIHGKPDLGRGVLFVGNHIGYLDIPILLSTIPQVSFVAKKEIGSWPVFGSAAKRIDTIFVSRNDKKSRVNAKRQMQRAIENGARIAVFPSGTTSIDESKPWRIGTFQVAKETQCLVQAFRIHYQPLRKVAYIDRDFFPTHLCRLFEEKSVAASIEFSDVLQIQDPMADSVRIQQWTQGVYRGETPSQ